MAMATGVRLITASLNPATVVRCGRRRVSVGSYRLPSAVLPSRAWSGSSDGAVPGEFEPHTPRVTVDVPSLAEKARLKISPEELEELEASITRIVGWFDQLKDADVSSVEPSNRSDVLPSVTIDSLRKDEVAPFPARDAMLQSVPEMEGNFIKVPRIMGGAPEAS